MRHLWQPLTDPVASSRDWPRGCTGCGIRAERRERESQKAQTPGQMVSVSVYILPGGRETEKLPDCDRRLLAHLNPTALPLGVKPTSAQELAELRVRFGQVQKANEELFARDVRVREILGADLSESTEAAAERVMTLADGLSARAARAAQGGAR